MVKPLKVCVIGLDGASWNIVRPLVESKKLPTIERLLDHGSYGDLESCIPPYTFPAWKCYSTGKNPGKLGVYWFCDIDAVKQRITPNYSTSFKSKEIWDYLGENDINCVILDMPTTYPVKPVKGAMVCHGAPRKSRFAYPQSLEQELIDKFNYKIHPDYLPPIGKDAAISSIKHVIDQRFEVARYLLNKIQPCFFHLTIYDIDTIEHFYWKDMKFGNVKYGKVIEDFWITIDSGIESLLREHADDNTCIFLMSDHGQSELKGVFDISKWLMQNNIPTPNRRAMTSMFFPKPGIIKTLHSFVFESLALLPPLRSWGTKKVLEMLLNPFGKRIPRVRSMVIPSINGGLYINRQFFRSQTEYEEFRKSMISDIMRIIDPKSGVRLAMEVYRREDIYSGRYVSFAPDLIIVPNEGFQIGGLGENRDVWNYSTEDFDYSAAHSLQGIFLASGPCIKKSVRIQGVKIYDIAPTVLHILDIPIPRDMDGRILKEIFIEGSPLARKQARYQETDEKERVMERIAELKAQGKI